MSAVSRTSAQTVSRARVWVRTKPTSNFAPCIYLQPDNKTIDIHCDRDPRKGYVNNQVLDWSFKCDGVLHNSSQEAVFDTVASDLVTAALEGYNGTIMAYGQTGAGKTFTMTGATESYQQRGIIPRALAQLFKEIDDRPDYAINVRISFLEIYNETMVDLLATLPESLKAAQMSPLTIVEDEQRVYVRGLQNHVANNEEEALNMLFEGETNRAIAAHTLNSQSSRSHCIFTLYIESRSRVESNAKYTLSKLNFVDLAGSERLGKTQSEGKTKEEAMHINKSLSFLEHAVLSLADKKSNFIPFRQSRLTHFLKDSIGGNCCTRLVANIWGEAAQLEETISTLRFAMRMMSIPVEPCVNVRLNPTITMKNLEKELAMLRKELAMHDILTNRSQMTYNPLTDMQRAELKETVAKYIDNKLDEIGLVNVRQIQAIFEAFREYTQQLAKSIEDKLRTRYTLIDKTSPEAIAAAQQAGLPVDDNGELVGDEDNTGGFGVGPAGPGYKMAASTATPGKKKDALKKSKKQDAKQTSSVTKSHYSTKATAPDATRYTTPSVDKRDVVQETGRSSQTKDQLPSRPSTPPPRLEAFEEFKKELGREINRILTSNKDILASKKVAYSKLAKQINCTKEEIDKSLANLAEFTQQREDEGEQLNEDGDVIISEEEYLEITRLKDLKAVYRTNFEELRAVKVEVQYCQRVVDQCRQRLIQEFEKWYSETYLGGSISDRPQPSQPTIQQSKSVTEDEQQQFGQSQAALRMADDEAIAFYNAQMRTQRRKIFTAAEAQFNPTMKKQPGTPVRTLKETPPSTLEVRY